MQSYPPPAGIFYVHAECLYYRTVTGRVYLIEAPGLLTGTFRQVPHLPLMYGRLNEAELDPFMRMMAKTIDEHEWKLSHPPPSTLQTPHPAGYVPPVFPRPRRRIQLDEVFTVWEGDENELWAVAEWLWRFMEANPDDWKASSLFHLVVAELANEHGIVVANESGDRAGQLELRGNELVILTR